MKSDKAADINFDNAYFYGKDGKFDVEKAKDAIMALAKYHGYPTFETATSMISPVPEDQR